MASPNSWLDIARVSSPNPSSPAGILNRPPPLPDPSDPIQFPPLSSSKPPLKSSPTVIPSPPTPFLPISAPPPVCTSPPPSSSLNPSTTAQLLASFTHSPLPDCSQIPRSTLSTVTATVTNTFSGGGASLLGAGPSITFDPPQPQTIDPKPTGPQVQHNSTAPPKPQVFQSSTWATKARANTDRSLRRLSPQSFSSNGVPRVVIPDEVYQKGADLHKEFLVCRFFGRTPAYKLIQNVLNYLWGKGRHLEIHMVPATKSVLVRVPNEHIRQKILLKKFWYVETSMFHVAQ